MRFLEEGNGQNSLSERLRIWNGWLGGGALIALLVKRVQARAWQRRRRHANRTRAKGAQ